MRQTSRFLAKLLSAHFQMKNVFRCLLFWSLAMFMFETCKKELQKKCDRRNIPDFNFFGKTAAGNLSHKERFSFFGCFEVSGWPYEKLEKWLQKKRWQMKYIKPQDFWQKLSEILETMVTPHLLNFLRDMDKFRIVRLQNRTNYQTSLH